MTCASEPDVTRFLTTTPSVEKAMVDSGVVLLEYWLEVGAEQQAQRPQSRISDPLEVWKLSERPVRDLRLIPTPY